MELTECSETSAHKIRTRGNNPNERINTTEMSQIDTLLGLSRKPSNHSDNGNLGNHSNNGNFDDNSKQQNNTIHVRSTIDSYTKQQ
jgi:hypothetical protein